MFHAKIYRLKHVLNKQKEDLLKEVHIADLIKKQRYILHTISQENMIKND